ncbi:adaptor protein MecA [Heyndrickxia acidiproducens]|jgi:adapter protein MecA 1/2|uniref:adaptor protein MecA n=1 Tax=Heyndrickxia acidiproducens TaxID=1121084 RepID=UPI0003658385|nr:adaptor protein MecA [Heyndrickxia acidiproducens]
MKLERLSSNKIKYSISFDELTERGIGEENLDSSIWNLLFDEMLELANQTYNVEGSDTLSIEIYSFNSHEIILILTLGDAEDGLAPEALEESRVSTDTVYSFQSIEDVISLAAFLKNTGRLPDSCLYQFEQQFLLLLAEEAEHCLPLFLEYGDRSALSPYMIREYGTAIFEGHALENLLSYFH